MVCLHVQQHEVTTHTLTHREIDEIERKPKTKNQNVDSVQASRHRLRDVPEWFTGVHRKSRRRRSFRYQGTRIQFRNVFAKVVSRKHSIYTHCSKDRNCEVRKRTKITRALCRKRIGDAVLRAENFGDLMTTDLQSSVKDVNLETFTDTQSARFSNAMEQPYPCKIKNSWETEKSLRKFLKPSEK